jgi:hypothetical protein
MVGSVIRIKSRTGSLRSIPTEDDPNRQPAGISSNGRRPELVGLARLLARRSARELTQGEMSVEGGKQKAGPSGPKPLDIHSGGHRPQPATRADRPSSTDL